MHSLRTILMKLAVLMAMSTLVLACGDETTDGDSGVGLVDNQSTDNDDECPEGQTRNPISGECVSGNDDQGTGGDGCDVGQEYDESTGECIDLCGPGESYHPGLDECIDDSGDDLEDEHDCEHHEMYDEDQGRCVPDPGECGPGMIQGQTCRPNEGVLPNANVTLEGFDCSEEPFTMNTTADSEGFYEFEDVPAGVHEMTITSGSFQVSEEISVREGEITDRESEDAKLCIESEEVEIAVVTGTFDDIPGLLEPMDIDFDVINTSSADSDSTAAFFGNLDELLQYDIIFVECAAPWGGMSSNNYGVDMADIEANIRQYVEHGNSLYASDWANPYVQETLPDAVHFYNEDQGITAPRDGSDSSLMADVTSSMMESIVGSTTTQLDFTLGWAVMEGTGPTTEAHFRADVDTGFDIVPNAPLMVTYDDQVGGGRVIYTSFHNDAQVEGTMQEILEFMIFQL